VAKLNAAELASFYVDYVDTWNRRDLESYRLTAPAHLRAALFVEVAATLPRGRGVDTGLDRTGLR
jgi:hypothetical protein